MEEYRLLDESAIPGLPFDPDELDDEFIASLRGAVFAHVVKEWRLSTKAAREYVLNYYATLTPEERARQYKVAVDLKIYWRRAAEAFDFFNTPEGNAPADFYLLDCEDTGADIWRKLMQKGRKWNRPTGTRGRKKEEE